MAVRGENSINGFRVGIIDRRLYVELD